MLRRSNVAFIRILPVSAGGGSPALAAAWGREPTAGRDPSLALHRAVHGVKTEMRSATRAAGMAGHGRFGVFCLYTDAGVRYHCKNGYASFSRHVTVSVRLRRRNQALGLRREPGAGCREDRRLDSQGPEAVVRRIDEKVEKPR